VPDTQAQLREAFEYAAVARLATIDADDRPNVVPICFAVREGTLYSAVDQKPKRSRKLKRLANIAARPSVSVLVDHYSDDWAKLWWMAAEGQAVIVDDATEAALAIDLLCAKYAQYRAAPPRGAVVAVRIDRWHGWSAALGTTTRIEERAER
jgi:PPOX class probable F420-dependent enzyme